MVLSIGPIPRCNYNVKFWLKFCGGSAVPGGSPSELILQSILACGLDEHRREEFHARLHAELLARLLSLAGEADDARRGVDEAADEETLRRRLAGRVLAHLGVQLVRAHHVTALSVGAEMPHALSPFIS